MLYIDPKLFETKSIYLRNANIYQTLHFWKNVQEAGSVRNIKKSAFQKTIIKFYVVGNSSIP